MNDSNNQTPLSHAGQRRRAEMLGELQNQVGAIHQLRRRKKIQRRLLVAGCLAVLLVSLVWVFNRPSSDDSNIARPDRDNSTKSIDDSPSLFAKSAYFDFALEKNKEDVEARYVVQDHVPQTSFQAIDNDELLSLLSEAGHSAELAKINGRLTVIPTSARAASAPN